MSKEQASKKVTKSRLPSGIKASKAVSKTPGVTLRTDGQLRWEARIRRSLNGEVLKFPLVRYPVDLNAAPNTEHHIDTARSLAEAYVARELASLELRQTPFANTSEAWTFGDLLRRYMEEIEQGVIKNASLNADKSNIRLFLGGGSGEGLAKTGMPSLIKKLARDLTNEDFIGKRQTSFVNTYTKVHPNGSTSEIKSGSKKKALTTIKKIFRHANETWKIEIQCPIRSLKSLNQDDSRSRTLSKDEWDLIIDHMTNSRTDKTTLDVICFARETAARRSECVKLDWNDLDLKHKTAKLRETKSKDGKYRERTIPLNPNAIQIIQRIRGDKDHKKGAVFVSSRGKRVRADTITQAWDRARQAVAEKHDLPEILTARVHDLRHTRITEIGHHLNPAEAAKISGHKDLKIFMRYFNPDPVQLGKKLDELESKKEYGSDVDGVVSALLALSPEDMTNAFMLAVSQRSKK
ncbi:tyrosine-type recombinase/integrase [Xanthomonas cannabis]|uniref:tyrosine-type recombinase/integrase n=1 Tax=Xanthomonas cannabis TaxID=1885674 RepID=UPI0005733162|nr:site-specific integrase [Xanthomonas cannabis]KHL55307.1 integrase [Xanthomonas cannabis pv. cannabis]